MMTESEFDFCMIRDKYAKPYNETQHKDTDFELYSIATDPDLLTIYYNEDPKSFRNWALEVGSGTKKGRIRDLIDNQIDEHVLEIAGNHDGSIHMACPPDPNSTLNVKKPFITILMRDIHGYCSVEFMASSDTILPKVLDNLGFSRVIHAKNFRSRCTIGELNCEIPMRLSPTWNYACVNLDETLMDAFGTHLSCVQRVKINANCRVRRVYFSDQIYPFRELPLEFKIKLTLSQQEKIETAMYEQFLSSEPGGKQHPPWALPKLTHFPSDKNRLSVRTQSLHQKGLLRKNVEIVEVPELEGEPEKYKNVAESKSTNAEVLRHMLHETFPQSRILLPTLSLIYPEKGATIQAEPLTLNKMGRLTRQNHVTGTIQKMACQEGPGRKGLGRLRKCFEANPTATKKGAEADEGNDFPTDWDMINFDGDENDDLPDTQPHRHILGCEYKTSDLAWYLKHRQVLGEYDLFSATVKNPDFLAGYEDDDQMEPWHSKDYGASVLNIPVNSEAEGPSSREGRPYKSVDIDTAVSRKSKELDDEIVTVPRTSNFSASFTPEDDLDAEADIESIDMDDDKDYGRRRSSKLPTMNSSGRLLQHE